MINYQIIELVLNKLYEIMTNPESRNADKISAAKVILDVSGLKNIKQDVKENEQPTVKKY